jgi:DNA-binding Lrp family transcriptional regulator
MDGNAPSRTVAAKGASVTAPNTLQRHFINRYQGGFPLCARPFAAAAEVLETSETVLVEAVALLLDSGLLTRFGPLFDANRLGGATTLAAMAVPKSRFDSVAQVINALPQVAHNYRREHRLNMWFIVASDRVEEIRTTLSRIEVMTGLRVYDRRLIQATQGGLPLAEEPYAIVARDLKLEPETVIARLERMVASGVIRRVGAVPHHYRLGLRGNGMSVWDVDDDVIDELGQQISELDFISHCYQRPRHPRVWRYNLFAMAHGADRATVLGKTEQVAALLGEHCRAHEVLFSTTVLKKTGLWLGAA